jgi:hypothetical protein
LQTILYTHDHFLHYSEMSPVYTLVASNELEVPPTVNEMGGGEKRELMLSDRKASQVLGVTVLRVPRLEIDQKASKILGTAVVRSGTDWEGRVDVVSSVSGRNRFRERFLAVKVGPLVLGESGEKERVSGKAGQKVLLSPKRSSVALKRHTSSHKPGPNLLLPSEPASPTSTEESHSPTALTVVGLLLSEDKRGGREPSPGPKVLPEDMASETSTLVDVGIIPPPTLTCCPPSPIGPLLTPPLRSSHDALASPMAMGNPELRRRRETIRSANKSVQVLGIEVRRTILKKAERENGGSAHLTLGG